MKYEATISFEVKDADVDPNEAFRDLWAPGPRRERGGPGYCRSRLGPAPG
jgi:hypothetical protein